MIVRSFFTLGMAVFLMRNATQARPRVLGDVAQANSVRLNSGTVSRGAAIYDGDRFSTERGGMLLLRVDKTVLELAENSVLTLRSQESSGHGVEAKLGGGTLAFSAPRAADFEIVACEAHIAPSANGKTVAQVSVAGPKEIRIYAQQGALQFSYGGETETITEGNAYRVILDPPDSDSKRKNPQAPLIRRKSFQLVRIGAMAVVAVIVIHEVFESPDRP